MAMSRPTRPDRKRPAMPLPSTRIATLTGDGDDGWGIFYRARAMQAAGVPVLELTIGEHDVRTAPGILDEMHRAARAGHTGYAAVPGIAALRRAVAAQPTVVAVWADAALMFYSSGVFQGTTCLNTTVNHAVLVVGYDTTGPEPYWLIKVRVPG